MRVARPPFPERGPPSAWEAARARTSGSLPRPRPPTRSRPGQARKPCIARGCRSIPTTAGSLSTGGPSFLWIVALPGRLAAPGDRVHASAICAAGEPNRSSEGDRIRMSSCLPIPAAARWDRLLQASSIPTGQGLRALGCGRCDSGPQRFRVKPLCCPDGVRALRWVGVQPNPAGPLSRSPEGRCPPGWGGRLLSSWGIAWVSPGAFLRNRRKAPRRSSRGGEEGLS